jgi:hypothetical protein
MVGGSGLVHTLDRAGVAGGGARDGGGGADAGRTRRLSGSVDRGMGWCAWATHGERGPAGGEGKWLGPGKSGIFDLFK